MADISRTIDIIFGVVDNTSGGLTSIGSSLDDFSKGAQNIVGPLANLGDTVLKVEAAVLGLGAAFLGASINAAGDFQAQVNEIGSLFEGNKDQIGAFSDQIKAFASTSIFSIDDINKALYSAVSAGVDYSKALDLLEVSQKAAAAGQADLEQTTVVLASVMNAYGLSAKDAADISDVLFTTVKVGQTTLPELANSLAQVTSIAASAGIPFEELGAAVATFTANGAPTEQAITGIRAALTNIIKPSKEAQETAAALGIEFNATALQSKGLAGFLIDTYNAANGNVETMAQLFTSVQGLGAALALGANTADKYSNTLKLMEERAGATQRAFEVMSVNIDYAHQRLLNSIKVTLISAGTPLLKEYADTVTALSTVFARLSFGINEGAFDPLYKVFNENADKLQALLLGIAQALPDALKQVDFTGLAGSFNDLAGAVGDIFSGVDLTSTEGLTRAIQFVVDSIESFTKLTEGIVIAWQEPLQLMAKAVETFNKLSDSEKVAYGSTLGFAQVAEQILGAVGALGKGIEALGNGIAFFGATQLVGSTKALLDFGKNLEGLSNVTKAGALTGIGYLGYEIGTAFVQNTDLGKRAVGGLTDLMSDWFGLTKQQTEALGPMTIKLDGANKALEKTAEQMGYVVKASEEFVGPLLPIDEFNDGVLSLQELNDAIKLYGDQWTNVNGKAVPTLEWLTEKTRENEDATRGMAIAVVDGVKSYEQLDTSAKSLDKTTEATKKATTAAEDFQVKMEQIASNERIKLIEARLELNVAEVEANAKKIEATFNSLGTGMESTANVISDALSALGGVGGFYGLEQLALIEKQLDVENKIRQEQFRLQAELIKTQIDAEQAKVDVLRRGGATIQVDGSGLAPHLEAFMYELLKAIQVRATEEGTALLLGI